MLRYDSLYLEVNATLWKLLTAVTPTLKLPYKGVLNMEPVNSFKDTKVIQILSKITIGYLFVKFVL